MCGRCVMVRNPTSLSRHCSYYPYRSPANTASIVQANCSDKTSIVPTVSITEQPDTIETKCHHTPLEPYWFKRCDQRWKPSYNICPRDYLPVLISTSHSHVCEVPDNVCVPGNEERMFQLMQWGLVPSWHKGPVSSFSMVLNNCRSDSIMSKASFKNAYLKGRRCAIPVDGFYEWQSKSGLKQPYFIHSPDKSELLIIAGIFDIHYSGVDEEAHFTVTMITTEAHSAFSEIHHRMPALLLSCEAVSDWLDYKRISGVEAFKLISPSFKLEWYPVGNYLADVRYKGEKCIELVNENTKPKSKSSKKNENNTNSQTLDAFFKRTPVKRLSSDKEGYDEVKRVKKDLPEE